MLPIPGREHLSHKVAGRVALHEVRRDEHFVLLQGIGHLLRRHTALALKAEEVHEVGLAHDKAGADERRVYRVATYHSREIVGGTTHRIGGIFHILVIAHHLQQVHSCFVLHRLAVGRGIIVGRVLAEELGFQLIAMTDVRAHRLAVEQMHAPAGIDDDEHDAGNDEQLQQERYVGTPLVPYLCDEITIYLFHNFTVFGGLFQ